MNDIFNGFDPNFFDKIFLFDERNPLLFNTGLFLLLFVGFLLIYQAMRRWRNAKMVFVILFSLYFYYKSSAGYCFILLGVCLMDFLLGNWLGRVKTRTAGKMLIALNVVVNIGMLVYFKYFNLIYETFANITNTHFDALDIILPAGISFFTFRSISYMVDIYRGVMRPATNLLEYMFYLTFFPPLLAGPVVRAKDMLPQIKANPIATHAMVSEGIFLIITGLIKKVIIADYISGNFVDRIFENPNLYSGFENLMGTLGFTLQIYCDFSGYSDMAIGIALLLGFRFAANFNAPFKSRNPTEFWHRWHISLSTWLRDYVYIPLGGNRCSKPRAYFNQMATMVIGGLWHGASWMYLVWGTLQGALLVIHKSLRNIWRLPEWLRDNLAVRGTNILLTFVLIVIGFTFFRFAMVSPHLDESWNYVMMMENQIVNDFRPEIIPQFYEAYSLIVLAIVVGYAMHFAPRRWTDSTLGFFTRCHPFIQAIILAGVIFFVIQVRQSDLVPFVYLQY